VLVLYDLTFHNLTGVFKMNIEDLYQISGENGLVTKLEKVKFTPYFLHLIPDGCNSEHDNFVKIESIQDVLDASNCDCFFAFDHYEYDDIYDKRYFYFEIINKNSGDVIHTLILDAKSDISMISKELKRTVQILVGHYDYKTSDCFYSEAVNNIGDQILTADETIKDEIKFLKELASGYTTREKEECRNALADFILMRKNQGLSLFETEEQKQDFINLCLSQLEE
jgi:hypothetical protein